MQIELDDDAALVLFEMLTSRSEEAVAGPKLDPAERNALACLEGALERTLVAPLSPDYGVILGRARESLVQRFGG